MQTENNIQMALNKLKSAQRCHPNATQTLIEEAIELLDSSPSPRITEQDARAFFESIFSDSDTDFEVWMGELGGRALLAKLNKPESVGVK